ncbi:MAG TPA: hypothetical protein VJA17_00245 [Candidatus Omnitrophota bacterium]|nr:hypothetical protein [Candidatus Omnitrophota bacterium]
MTYLFLGENSRAKDEKIGELKKKILTPPQSFQFDYETLHGAKLEEHHLKKALMNLPALAPRRLVVIREGHRLSPKNQEILVQFLEKSYDHAVIILDSNEWDHKNSFVKKIRKMVDLIEFSSTKKIDVFDLTRTIDLKKETEALKILDQLLKEGTHPLQILGALVWFWKKSRGRFSGKKFKEGLLALQEADLNIKRSRLKPEYAVELLVVKLCLKEVG